MAGGCALVPSGQAGLAGDVLADAIEDIRKAGESGFTDVRVVQVNEEEGWLVVEYTPVEPLIRLSLPQGPMMKAFLEELGIKAEDGLDTENKEGTNTTATE